MITLYHNEMSTCSQKVRLCLAEKGLEWTSHHLDLRAGDQQQDWYVKLNPRAVVPTLVDGDDVVPESNVILEYLEERYPEPALMPRQPIGKARVRLWTKQLDEGIHDAGISVLSFALAFSQQYLAKGEKGRATMQGGRVTGKREAREQILEQGLDAPPVRAAVHRMQDLIALMQASLEKSAWLAGDGYTLADAAFTPYATRLDHLGLLGLLDDAPLVQHWYDRCRQRPSYQAAIRQWENKDYLALMQSSGEHNWPTIRALMRGKN
jgi:glutathione S-transferase